MWTGETGTKKEEIYYQLDIRKMKEIDKWLDPFRTIWEKKFNQLDKVLNALKKKKKKDQHVESLKSAEESRTVICSTISQWIRKPKRFVIVRIWCTIIAGMGCIYKAGIPWSMDRSWTDDFETKYMNFVEGGKRFYAMVSPSRWRTMGYSNLHLHHTKTNFKLFNAFADQDENPQLPGSDWDYTFSEKDGITTVQGSLSTTSHSPVWKVCSKDSRSEWQWLCLSEDAEEGARRWVEACWLLVVGWWLLVTVYNIY